MKTTLTDKLNDLIIIELEIKNDQIWEFFGGSDRPEKLFKVDHIGNIKEIELIGFSIGHFENGRNVYKPYFDKSKKPTKKLIAEIEQYIEKIKSSERIIYANYKDFGTGAYKFHDVVPEKGVSFYEQDLVSEADRRNKLYAPKDGHTACAYCRKQTPNENLVQKVIIGRGRKRVFNNWKGRYEDKACVTEDKLLFCSGNCAGNEQMSREG